MHPHKVLTLEEAKKLEGPHIVIPEDVTSIGPGAFLCRKDVTSITIPDGTIGIGEYAFWQCEQLTSVIIPDSMYYVGFRAFEGCKRLASVVLPKGRVILRDDGEIFAACGLTNLTIPGNIETIVVGMFTCCEHLTNVVIADGVREIDSEAFSACEALVSVTIPGSVVSISRDAFSECPKLTVSCPEGSYAHEYCVSHNIRLATFERTRERTMKRPRREGGGA